jgi:hypothetical protein
MQASTAVRFAMRQETGSHLAVTSCCYERSETRYSRIDVPADPADKEIRERPGAPGGGHDEPRQARVRS